MTASQTALKAFIRHQRFIPIWQSILWSTSVLQALLRALRLAALHACLPTNQITAARSLACCPGCLALSNTCQSQVLRAKTGSSCKEKQQGCLAQ